MATATSRKAAPPKKLLDRRNQLARDLLDLNIKLGPDFVAMAKTEAELKLIATDCGEPFKVDFGGDGYVSASGAVAAEFKGDVPVVQTEAWLRLKAAERKDLEKRGIVVVTPQYGKASNGRVTVKVLR